MPKKYSVYSPSAEVQRRMYRRSRQNSVWAGMAGTFLMLRVIWRAVGRRPEVVATDRLKPGQSLSITAIAPPTRRQRKAARRAPSTD
ncbi:MAG TPA: hypothetical protein VID93_07110 [Acidimicrobiales bacterium]